jgi:PTH1 family peptidyl-tRNA hydrolase
MKLVVGLGNPEDRYKDSRHNIGFMVVDALGLKIRSAKFETRNRFQSEISINKSIILAKPTTQMNSSGLAVAKLVNFYKIRPADLWVIHDDLDIKLGQYKIQKGRGPKIHKGLNSIYQRFGKVDFWHVRVGVENRKKPFKILNFQLTRKVPGERYVLKNFTDEEVEILNPIIGNIVVDLNSYLSK